MNFQPHNNKYPDLEVGVVDPGSIGGNCNCKNFVFGERAGRRSRPASRPNAEATAQTHTANGSRRGEPEMPAKPAERAFPSSVLRANSATTHVMDSTSDC